MRYNQNEEAPTADFSRTHGRLISLSLSAMLTSAFFITAPEGAITAAAGPNIQMAFTRIRESGLPGTASMLSPASVDTPQSVALSIPAKPAAPLSAEQLQKILKDLGARNKLANLDPKLTDSLGLTQNGEVLTLQYRAVKDDLGISHGFFRLNGNMGYLVVQRTAKGITTCRVDTNLNLVTAVTNPLGQPGVYITSPPSESAKILRTELLVWAGIANQIMTANS